jgi:hypothetical protein
MKRGVLYARSARETVDVRHDARDRSQLGALSGGPGRAHSGQARRLSRDQRVAHHIDLTNADHQHR